ncbi:MAG: STAS domain-containing protein [Deltaproteobacteria bacterium]|nr:STAS domain-containing protein [Candidatus Anaeroferrophillacea bacterium]
MKQLDITFRHYGRRLVAEVAGSITVLVRDDFQHRVVEQLDQETFGQLVIDLAGVPAIDSSGLGAIFAVYKHAARYGTSCYLLNPNEAINDLLRVTHMEKVIPVKTSLADVPAVS